MKTNKIKSVPLRMCVVCKQMKPKAELLRIVCDKSEKVFIDETHRANGRGAYICDCDDCVNICVRKKILNRAFKRELPDEIYTSISEEYAKKSRS